VVATSPNSFWVVGQGCVRWAQGTQVVGTRSNPGTSMSTHLLLRLGECTCDRQGAALMMAAPGQWVEGGVQVGSDMRAPVEMCSVVGH
jgi:hypothetical protein